MVVTEKVLNNKVETTLSLKQQNNAPDELIKKQAGLEANLLLHKNFKICQDRSYKFKLWLTAGKFDRLEWVFKQGRYQIIERIQKVDD